MNDEKLTPKQQRFVEEYLIDLNASQAAIRAGYAPASAGNNADKLLKNTNISAAIAAAMRARNERVGIDADYVLNRLVEIDKMDVIDILNDNGSVKPIVDWPPIWRQFISGMDLSELFEGRGDEREMIGFLKKIKWPDKVKNLEMLGKHVDVQAWKEKVDVDVKGKLTLQEALELAAEDQRN